MYYTQSGRWIAECWTAGYCQEKDACYYQLYNKLIRKKLPMMTLVRITTITFCETRVMIRIYGKNYHCLCLE